MQYSLLGLFLLASAASAADKKPAKTTYDDHVLPILRDKCINCHNQDKKRGGLVLNNYTALMQGGGSGAAVKPGDAENSPLYRLTAHKSEPFMPPNSPKIADEQIATLERWINEGALENAGSKVIITNKPKTEIGLASIVRGRPEGPPPMPPVSLRLDPVVLSTQANAVTAMASNPWSPVVAIAGQKQVILYNADTLELLGMLPFAEGTPHVLQFSRNGSLLLAGGGRGGKSGKVVVWNVRTGERVIEVGDENDAVLATDISPDQTQIALGGPSKMLRIYSTKDGKLLHEVKKHTDWITTLEFSPDGVLLASGDRNGGLHVWEAFTAREYFSLRGHTACITAVSWRNDSNVLASASEDTTVRQWEMENGGQIRSWGAHGAGTLSVRYSRDGRLVSAGRDRTVKLWDGNGAQQRVFEALPDLALCAIFTHDDTRVIGSDWTGQIRLWATADGKLLGTLSPNPPPVSEQFTSATRDLLAAVVQRDQRAATLKASKAAADVANADLAAAQKLVADSPALLKAANDAVLKNKATADAATVALQAGLSEVRAREILVQALTEAATKVKAEAAKVPADKPLANSANRAQELVNGASADLETVRKTVPPLMANLNSANQQLAVAQKQLADVTAQTQAAPKLVEARTATAKAAQAKLVVDQSALDQAQALVTQLSNRIDRLKSALVLVQNVGK